MRHLASLDAEHTHLTREQKKLRRALIKEVDLHMRQAVAMNGWKQAGGFVFKESHGWFADLSYATHPEQMVSTARLYVKPMTIDPLFWEIVGLSENKRQPLSFRARGAWTCRSPEIAELIFDDTGLDAFEIVARIVRWTSDEFKAHQDDCTMGSFIDRILTHPHQMEAFSWLPALTTALILDGRADLARERCLAARHAGESGGFAAGDDTFTDMALAWMDRSLRPN